MGKKTWTPEQDEVLRKLYPKTRLFKTREQAWADILKKLPGRTMIACQNRARRLRVTVRHPWTVREQQVLRALWSEVAVVTLQRKLQGRSWEAIQQQAARLKLTGRWQGYVALRTASIKLGYAVQTLKKIFAEANVRVWLRNSTRRDHGRLTHHMVEWDEAVRAVNEWDKKETAGQAAARTGISERAIVHWLQREKLTLGTRGATTRLDRAVMDRVIEAHLPSWTERKRRLNHGRKRDSGPDDQGADFVPGDAGKARDTAGGAAGGAAAGAPGAASVQAPLGQAEG